MNRRAFSVALLLIYPLHGYSSPARAALEGLYGRISRASDEHTFVLFSAEERTVNARMAESEVCQAASAFAPVPKAQWLEALSAEAFYASQKALGRKDRFRQFRRSLQEALAALDEEIGDALIELCVDRSTPAYSDGHCATFVKINGALSMVHELGYPD